MKVTSTLIQKIRKQAMEEAKRSSLGYSQLLEKYAHEAGYKNWKDLLDHKVDHQPVISVGGSDMLFPRFRKKLLDADARNNFKQSMVIDRAGKISVCYAAFDHVNRGAKVVLVGLTPGEQQAIRANETVAEQLEAGASDQAALEAAKVFASFSGPMRANLVALLDHIGLAEKLGIVTTEQLFEERSDLCHFTSALRYPVFVDGENYSGNPSPLGHPLLRRMVDQHLSPELSQFGSNVWFIPLGKGSSQVLSYLIERGVLPGERVLKGLPHPSGANAERIAYFLGRKKQEALSPKTNADALDKARSELMHKLNMDTIMDRQDSNPQSTSSNEFDGSTLAPKEKPSNVNATTKVMPTQLEDQIIHVARSAQMTAMTGSPARHELELRFTCNGREESYGDFWCTRR